MDAWSEADDAQLEPLAGWPRGAATDAIPEATLPAALATALADMRAERPGHALVCLAFRTLVDGAETARIGSIGDDVQPSEILVLSVVTSEVTPGRARVVAHSVVIRDAGG